MFQKTENKWDIEIKNIKHTLNSGFISGNGPYTKKCEELLQNVLGTLRVLLTTSCTHALEMAALLLDIQNGDEVILPSFTFVSTANAFVLRGAHPIFVDIRPDTLNLDESQLEGKITERTRAIIPVHYAGIGCDMETIMNIAEKYGISVIEDNAHGLFGKYQLKFLGTLGRLSATSFHATKNFTCGEGGALFINDPKYIERAEIIREKGTNKDQFIRGEVDRYTWIDIGSSYLLSDILAAFLYAQLENRERIVRSLRRVWEFYHLHFIEWADENGVRLPTVPPHCNPSFHLYYIILPSTEHRCRLMEYLSEYNINTAFHYLPLHLSQMGQKWGYKANDYPVTENVSGRLLRLPFYKDLSQQEQEQIVKLVTQTKL